MNPSPRRQRAALSALEYLAEQEHDPERANQAIDRKMRAKLEPRGLARGYSYETVRRSRLSGRVGHELYGALLRFFDFDEDNEDPFLDRFSPAEVRPTTDHPPASVSPKAIDAAEKAAALLRPQQHVGKQAKVSGSTVRRVRARPKSSR